MGRLAVIDGVVLGPSEARISVYDRGFLYGDSVFETVRTYGGKLFALTEHLTRLARSADLTGIVVPVPLAQLGREAEAAITAAGNPESQVRVMLTRGSGPMGLDPGLAGEPCRVILVEPLTPPSAQQYLRGISVRCVQTVRASDAAHSAKVGNYLASALALRDARAAGADEALVVNRDGVVVEGTTFNVFAVLGGKLVTPPLEIGILAGITRAVVIEQAERMGLEVSYRAVTPAALARSDEVFITSTIREVLPVTRIDDAPVSGGVPGPVTRRLHRAFRAHVGDPLP
jgi:branched-chain amino acid aminotransferase